MGKWSIPLLLLCLMTNIVIAQSEECDYEVEIILNESQFTQEDFEWRMRAINNEGTKTNITGIAQIKSSDEIKKTYKPWTSSSISRQKTSTRYSPNIDPGKYTLLAQISVECRDINIQNNFDTKEFTILGSVDEEKISEKSGSLLENTENTANSAIVDEQPEKVAEDHQNPEPETQKYSRMVYESSSQKSISLILPLLLAASIIVNIILIWKKM